MSTVRQFSIILAHDFLLPHLSKSRISTHKKCSAKEILQFLSSQPKERTLRDDLTKLKELGLIATTGKGPGAVWYLKK